MRCLNCTGKVGTIVYGTMEVPFCCAGCEQNYKNTRAPSIDFHKNAQLDRIEAKLDRLLNESNPFIPPESDSHNARWKFDQRKSSLEEDGK